MTKNICPGDFDILIGMDIINQGSLTIECLGGKTVLRFQVPKSLAAPRVRRKG